MRSISLESFFYDPSPLTKIRNGKIDKIIDEKNIHTKTNQFTFGVWDKNVGGLRRSVKPNNCTCPSRSAPPRGPKMCPITTQKRFSLGGGVYGVKQMGADGSWNANMWVMKAIPSEGKKHLKYLGKNRNLEMKKLALHTVLEKSDLEEIYMEKYALKSR